MCLTKVRLKLPNIRAIELNCRGTELICANSFSLFAKFNAATQTEKKTHSHDVLMKVGSSSSQVFLSDYAETPYLGKNTEFGVIGEMMHKKASFVRAPLNA